MSTPEPGKAVTVQAGLASATGSAPSIAEPEETTEDTGE